MKFDITVIRLNIRGYLLWYDPSEGDFGLSLWFSLVKPGKKKTVARMGFSI